MNGFILEKLLKKLIQMIIRRINTMARATKAKKEVEVSLETKP